MINNQNIVINNIKNYLKSQNSESNNTNRFEQIVQLLGLLGFEDCVFYRYQKRQGNLKQEAAFGPKNPTGNGLYKPIVLSVGQGVVGYTALHLRLTLINEAKYDKRYVIDDEIRQSELAVPIFDQGELVGVIDSEHDQPYFFTQQHIEMINSVMSSFGLTINHDYPGSFNLLRPFGKSEVDPNFKATDVKSVIDHKKIQDLVSHCLKHFNDSSELAKILNNNNDVFNDMHGVDDFRQKIKSIANSYNNNKTLKYQKILLHTYFLPLPNQMAVAEKLYMGYSTYRRHLKKARDMLVVDFIEMVKVSRCELSNQADCSQGKKESQLFLVQ